MANDKDVKIGIKTVADTSGAEKMEAALQGVEETSRGFGGMLDGVPERAEEVAAGYDKVTESTKTLTAESAKLEKVEADLGKSALEAAEGTKEINASLKDLKLLQVVGSLSDVVGHLRQLVPASSASGKSLEALGGGLNMVSAGMSTFVATGNPVAGLLAGIVAGVPAVIAAYNEMRTAQDNLLHAGEIFARNMVDSETQRKSLAQTVYATNLKAALEAEAAAAKKLSDEFARANKLADAKNALAQVRLTAAGATPADLKLQSGQQYVADQHRAIDQAQSQQDSLRQHAAIQQQVVLSRQKVDGTPIVDLEAEKAKYEELKAALEKSVLDLANEHLVVGAKIDAAVLESNQQVVDEFQDKETERAKGLASTLDQIATAENGNVSAGVAAATANVKNILADGVVLQAESAKLNDAINQFRTSSEAGNRAYQKYISDLIAIGQGNMKALVSQQDAIAAMIEELNRILGVVNGQSAAVGSVITRLSGMEQTVAALQQRAAQ